MLNRKKNQSKKPFEINIKIDYEMMLIFDQDSFEDNSLDCKEGLAGKKFVCLCVCLFVEVKKTHQL